MDHLQMIFPARNLHLQWIFQFAMLNYQRVTMFQAMGGSTVWPLDPLGTSSTWLIDPVIISSMGFPIKNGGFTMKNGDLTNLTMKNGWRDDNGHDEKEPIDWRYRFHIFLAYFLGLRELDPEIPIHH